MKKYFIFVTFALIATINGFAVSYKNNPEISYLDKTSKAFSEIARRAIPGVVFIKTQYKTHSPFGYNGAQHPFDLFGDEFFRRFFGPSRPQRQSPQTGGGSGCLVSDDGFILTNYHVIKDADTITTVLNDGREFEATLVGMDPRTDLAVLKIEASDLPFLDFGSSDDLEIGEWVIAIGNPFALESSLTVGVVSAKGRQDLGISTLEDFIQTDAAIGPGNSGGCLLNLNGEVIGINTAIVTKSGGYTGIGFAIPSNLAKHVMDQIISSGVVTRAYLGVILQPIDKELADAMSLDQNDGILISEVIKDSPASKAGLEDGDIILNLNNKKVKNVNKFRNEIALMDPGASVKIDLLRQNKNITLDIPLGTLTEAEVATTEMYQKLGIEVEDLETVSPQIASKLGILQTTDGVVITKVKPGSPAAFAKLEPYSLITGVVVNWNNQKKVTNLQEFNNALKEVGNKKHVVLIVRHQHYQRYYTLKL